MTVGNSAGSSSAARFDAFYNRSGAGSEPSDRRGPSYAPHVTGGAGRRRGTQRHGSNEMDLEDLFNDFGNFGFGDSTAKASGAKPHVAPRHEPPKAPGEPRAGEDVRVELVVPESVAKTGGSVTAVYFRLRRSESWRPGDRDPGIVRVQDVADVRIIPGAQHGEILRERALGDAGPYGGPYGDLVATIRIKREPAPTVHAREAIEEPEVTEKVLTIGVAAAILGERVECETPQGKVKLIIPPGTSSGTQLRLRGKGPRSADGTLEDLYVIVHIAVPKEVDEASRKLIEEFNRLNPVDGNEAS